MNNINESINDINPQHRSSLWPLIVFMAICLGTITLGFGCVLHELDNARVRVTTKTNTEQTVQTSNVETPAAPITTIDDEEGAKWPIAWCFFAGAAVIGLMVWCAYDITLRRQRAEDEEIKAYNAMMRNLYTEQQMRAINDSSR